MAQRCSTRSIYLPLLVYLQLLLDHFLWIFSGLKHPFTADIKIKFLPSRLSPVAGTQKEKAAVAGAAAPL